MSKYQVFKSTGDEYEQLEPGSYFVIRRQDVFGAQALHGYAHLIVSAVELDSIHSFLTPKERHRLEVQADDVSELASKWMTGDKKIPD